jgi:hypothetical protein
MAIVGMCCAAAGTRSGPHSAGAAHIPSLGGGAAVDWLFCAGEHVDVAVPFGARVEGNVVTERTRMRPLHFELWEGEDVVTRGLRDGLASLDAKVL